MFKRFLSSYKRGLYLLVQAFCCVMIFAFLMLPAGLVRFIGSPSGSEKRIEIFGLATTDLFSCFLYAVFAPIAFNYAFRLCFSDVMKE